MTTRPTLLLALLPVLLAGCNSSSNLATAPVDRSTAPMATVHEPAPTAFAPNVPPPITRKAPAILDLAIDVTREVAQVAPDASYEFWTFGGHAPGPFVRARVGDTLHVTLTDKDKMGMPHSIDFHAVSGPGGGMMALMATPDAPSESWFKLLQPGLYLYHCGTPPVMDHVANGMYGLILVEPEEGLPKADHEYYVMQSEVYARPKGDGTDRYVFSHEDGLDEKPRWVVFNGAAGAITGDGQLGAKTGENVRLYVGNAGPNLVSSFHMMGTIFSTVWRDGDMVDAPAHGLQTVMIPPGSAAALDLTEPVPGNYTFVDHALFRIEKGAAGVLNVTGAARPDIYLSGDDAKDCKGCLKNPGQS